jgi:hypothetical protein
VTSAWCLAPRGLAGGSPAPKSLYGGGGGAPCDADREDFRRQWGEKIFFMESDLVVVPFGLCLSGSSSGREARLCWATYKILTGPGLSACSRGRPHVDIVPR